MDAQRGHAKREALNAQNIELSAELDLMRERHEARRPPARRSLTTASWLCRGSSLLDLCGFVEDEVLSALWTAAHPCLTCVLVAEQVLSALGKFNPEDLANVSRTNAALASSIQALLPKLDKKPEAPSMTLGSEPLSSSGLSAPIFPSTQMV